MAKKIAAIDDAADFVPSRPSQRKAAKAAVKTKKKAAAASRPPWLQRHKWLVLGSCFVICLLVIGGATLKLRADIGGRNYRTNAKVYLDSASAVLASSRTPHDAAAVFDRLKAPKFESVVAAENYSADYKAALADKKLVESIRGGIAAKLTEYSMLADFEARYQKELAAVAKLHDEEPISIDQASDWAKQYQAEVKRMQKTVVDSQVPPEVQRAKDALKQALSAASAALNDVVSAADIGRVDTYNEAFDKLTAAENNAADAYAIIQSVEPDATQATLLTEIEDAKKQL